MKPAFDWAVTFTEAVLAYGRRCTANGTTPSHPSPLLSGFEGSFVLRDDGGAELDRFSCDGLGRVEIAS